MDNKELQESIEFFDGFVNATLSAEPEKFPPIEVVKHYNIVKTELAKAIAVQES